MSLILITYRAVGSCRVIHAPSGAEVTTNLPPPSGAGDSFSATDLLAAALGVCIATNIDSVAVRHGVPLDALSLHVEKTMAMDPKRVTGLAVLIRSAMALEPDVHTRLARAACHCVVHQSLHPDIEVSIGFEFSGFPE